jgi:hypothetical protein
MKLGFGGSCRGLAKQTIGHAGKSPFSHATACWRSEPSTKAPSPLIYPQASASQHTDLTTFLAYAKRTGLDEKSSVYVGTYYEYAVAAALSRYGFALKRVGGVSDLGTDLLGEWKPASTSRSPAMRVLLQCKAGAQKAKPQWIRELEGAFVGAPAGWRGTGVLGFLVGEQPATKGVRESMGRSQWPLGYLCCSRDGVLRQMLWNARAEAEGLEGFGVVTRHGDADGEERLVLVRKGKVLPLMEQSVH